MSSRLVRPIRLIVRVAARYFEFTDSLNPWGPSGVVGATFNLVAAGALFTVTSNTYFDAPGSTITFSTFEQDGWVHLQQSANAFGANFLVARGTEQGLAEIAWGIRANNLMGYYR